MTREQQPEKIRGMFNRIAGSYDFLNHFFSLNIDAMWRRKAVQAARDLRPKRILDVAAGTFDLSLAFARRFPEADVIGLDFACDMLTRGLHKIEGRRVVAVNGDGLQLPLPDRSVDLVSIAFGIRNFADMDQGLAEFLRVLKPGGRAVILEFTPNRNPLFRFYSGVIMPAVGRIISRDPDAYAYLHRSVQSFPDVHALARRMADAGFHDVRWQKLTMGIAALHVGVKPDPGGE